MIRNEYAGLGDLYSDAATDLTRALTSEGKWRIMVFGVGSSLTEERQKYWRGRIQDKYNSLVDSGQIDPADRADANSAANNGVMMIPSAEQYHGDKLAQAAIWRINEQTGLKDLWNQLLAEMKQAAQDTAAGLDNELAALDALYTGMYYVSGAAALDKLNEKWDSILDSVKQGQALIDQAKTDLDDEGQKAVMAALQPINDNVATLQGYFSTADAGKLGSVQLVAIAVVGVALAVATLAAAYIVKQLATARNIYADQAARMLKQKQDNAQGDYDLTVSNIQQEFNDGTITAEQRDDQLKQAQNSRDLALTEAAAVYQEQQKNLPSSGVGGLSLGLGAVAAVGLVALVLIMKK